MQRAALLLRDLLADYPEQAPLAREILLCEQEGDRIVHDILHRLASTGQPPRARSTPPTCTRSRARSTTSSTSPRRPPTSSGSTASRRRWSRRRRWPRCSWAAPSRSPPRCAGCATAPRSAPQLVEIHRLENEADRLQRAAVAGLFANGIDPMMLIRWKDIFDTLEAAVDACETVANVLEGIAIKRAQA